MKYGHPLLLAVLIASPAFAQGSDECIGATPLVANVAMAFVTSGNTASPELWVCVDQAPDLWFQYTTVGTTGELTVETCGSGYDTALEIFSGSCGSLALLECNDDSCSQQSSVTTTVPATPGETFFIRVGGFGGASGSGEIRAYEGAAPDCAMPDAFEVNTDCSNATPLGDGTYPGLNLEEADNDYYALTIPDGATLEVDISFFHSFGDVDLFLWDPAVECDTNVAGPGGTTLDRSTSTAPRERVTYANTSGAPLSVILEVDMFTGGACNDYDMTISGVGVASGPIGSNYCSANANSTGASSTISAVGSASVTDNTLSMNASGLPTFSFGFFIVSDQTGFVTNPGGSSGNLCLGGSIGRYVGPGQVMSSMGTGSISLGIDLTAIPRPTGPVTTAPGDTWNFQLWHRDSGPAGPTSNFTDGITVMFI